MEGSGRVKEFSAVPVHDSRAFIYVVKKCEKQFIKNLVEYIYKLMI